MTNIKAGYYWVIRKADGLCVEHYDGHAWWAIGSEVETDKMPDKIVSIIEYPVQEGNEYDVTGTVEIHRDPSHLPVDDEQPDSKEVFVTVECAVCKTQWNISNRNELPCPNCTPRSAAPNDPGAHSMNC